MVALTSFKIVIPPSGPPRAVYSPEAAELLQGLGRTTITRVSHVEPYSGLSSVAKAWLSDNSPVGNQPATTAWFADLTPVDGPVLGPYADNKSALAAELAWLDVNLASIASFAK